MNPTEGTLEYDGHCGSVEYSEEDGVFFGKVLDICGLVSYEGATIQALEEDFHDAVDDYNALFKKNS